MSADRYAPRPLAGWYMIAAIAAFVFMVAACGFYLMQMASDPADLPLDQRAAIEAQPVWLTGAYAVAVWAGAFGSLMLLFRRALAQPLLLLSLAGVAVWVAGLILVPGVRETISANDLAVAIVIAAVIWTIFWFARHSARRGWLR